MFLLYRGLGGGRKASGLRTSFRSPAAHFGGGLATPSLQGHFALFVDIVKSDVVLIFTFLSDVKRSLSALKSKQASRDTAKSPALQSVTIDSPCHLFPPLVPTPAHVYIMHGTVAIVLGSAVSTPHKPGSGTGLLETS